MLRYHLVLAICFLAACSSQPSANSVAPKSDEAKGPCSTATVETLMEIKSWGDTAVSICRQDGVGDCLYSPGANKTFETGRPDLNRDGHPDILVRDYTGVHGINEIVHYLGYAACPMGGYVEILDGFADSVEPAHDSFTSGWQDLNIVRGCFDEAKQDVVYRSFQLSWSKSQGKYGPPNDDPDLVQYCTDKEMTLPAG